LSGLNSPALLKNKIIFIAPLDWGLGHASRCVPLIKKLLEHNEVILGVTPTTALILNEEFPQLKKVDLLPYNIQYSNKLPLFLKLLVDVPKLYKVLKKEKKQLESIIKEYRIDLVISDNRFGLYNKQIDSIYLTHQLYIEAGIFSFMANAIHHHFIKQFNKVWVPDFEEDNMCLAGKLSRNHSLNSVVYIGALSRLSCANVIKNEYDYLCLLSGPEPLRSDLERLLIEKANASTKRICIVRGTQTKLDINTKEYLTLIDLPNSKLLSELILNSSIIVCRSGYSTLMDLHHLQKSEVILIPTPGQYEQLYLAAYWKQKTGAKVLQQSELYDFVFH
jgi:uncharacterized protein (TIGR00661 family)